MSLEGKIDKALDEAQTRLAAEGGVATPQDKVIEALEAEILKLKTQLSDTEEKYQKYFKKFGDLMIEKHGGGRRTI